LLATEYVELLLDAILCLSSSKISYSLSVAQGSLKLFVKRFSATRLEQIPNTI
jgi:hypothetical protein